MAIGISLNLHSLYTLKNSDKSLDGLWYGKIWQILANIIAQEIPPKNPIALELIPLFFDQTFMSLRVCLKFSS